ncbi:DMT family transporter [Oceanispirochaeta sp.]|jgi:drug/metabolite transporter (DMT)-like permease|uniref:DMT family transporter n=1 Tax=Oceanispirochaeta sp. TaxID=2035350 RepID=UPI0026382FE1|nr:DMT family transporter [Oceanispirochaeta sp.]MDA3956370.1 DMT family transporter [Oceanispirochaeta sp.]
MKKNESRFFLLMILAMSLWAGSWVSAKMIASEINPGLIVFWRFLITFVSFLPFLLFKIKKITSPDRRSLAFSLGASLFICLYNILFLLGLKGSLAGKGGVMVTTLNPLITYLLSSFLFRQKIMGDQKTGLFLGLTGGLLLMEPWKWETGALVQSHNLLFLGCAFCWSVLTLMSQQAQKKMHPLWFNSILYGFGTLLMAFFLPREWIDLSLKIPTVGWVNIIYLALFAGTIGAGVYFLAASRLGASKASTMTFLIPVLALLLGRIILGERAEWNTLAGGALSITAVLIINDKIRIPRFQTSD